MVDEVTLRQTILTKMESFGKNVAPFPFSETMEYEGGVRKWVIDIHVRVIRETEFEIEAEGRSLQAALKSAHISLSRRITTGITI